MGFGKLNLKIEKIYNDYGKMILNIAYKTLGDVRLAEDAVQESILRMMKYSNKISKLDGNELKNYVARITRNVCNDIRKRKSKEKLTYDFEEIESICDDCNLEDYVIDKESVNILKSEICKLNSKYRDPLTLHKLQNYTIKEVAELLNVPERTVKLRINKAITMLKSVLTEGADIDGK